MDVHSSVRYVDQFWIRNSMYSANAYQLQVVVFLHAGSGNGGIERGWMIYNPTHL